MNIEWLNTDNFVGIVLIVGFLVVGSSLLAHAMAFGASELLRALMSNAGDRDEELMAGEQSEGG